MNYNCQRLVAILAVMAGACGGDRAASRDPVVRDSAGIRIVENDHTQPEWTAEAAWRLSEEPVTRIGNLDGDAGNVLFRVSDARRLADGSILVVNSGSHELRRYDADGQLIAAVGRAGEGPREFKRPYKVYDAPDGSLLVIDAGRDVAVLAPDLTFQRRFTPELPDDFEGHRQLYASVDQFADGSLLFQALHPHDRDRRGVGRNLVRMVRVDPEGFATSLGDFEDQTIFYGGDGEYMFGPRAWEAAADSSMWYGPGDRLEFREIGFDGELIRLVRLDRPSRPVTDADVQKLVDERLGRARGQPYEQRTRDRLAGAVRPDSFPPHLLLETDDYDNLWVMDYWSWVEGVDQTWTVFAPDGRFLGDVLVPAGLRVFSIHDRHLIGSWTDELGVEFVHVYAIDKPQ